MVQNKGARVHTQKKGSDPFGALPFSMYPPVHGGLSFLYSLIFLDRLGGDGRCVLGGVTRLRIGRSRADRAPCFARGHAKGEANRNYRYE